MRKNKKSLDFWKKKLPAYLLQSQWVVLALVTAFLAVLLALVPAGSVEANRNIHHIALPAGQDNMLSADVSDADVAVKSSAQKSNSHDMTLLPDDNSRLQWRPATLVAGDNLTSIFKRLGLRANDVFAVANARREAGRLRRLMPGETIAVGVNEEGMLTEVKYSRSKLEHYLYRRQDGVFDGEKVLYQPEIITTYKEGVIENSLFLDANRAGLTEAKIMELADIFGWDIDFALDIRSGDRFSALYEEKYLEGEKVGYGNILAASFTNQGKLFHAVRFEEPDGSGVYYTPAGKAMRKTFLRAPLDFTRISSNFNLRRQHPIHKKIRAHRGVDYAAPTNTPVYAAGDGKVIESAYSKANGNYIFIQHGEKYITKYLHLNKRSVRKGQAVSQRQTVGLVGSTGYATGPHLHYELLINGVHQNPRTAKLPDAQPIDSSKMAEFSAQTTPLLAKLKRLGSTQIALRTTD
jgi:murein DD-endopeptidase MepM/ murein hydrolase activator NlpD